MPCDYDRSRNRPPALVSRLLEAWACESRTTVLLATQYLYGRMTKEMFRDFVSSKFVSWCVWKLVQSAIGISCSIAAFLRWVLPDLSGATYIFVKVKITSFLLANWKFCPKRSWGRYFKARRMPASNTPFLKGLFCSERTFEINGKDICIFEINLSNAYELNDFSSKG